MRIFAIIFIFSLLSGCAHNLPPVLFMPKSVDVAINPLTTDALGTVTVQLAEHLRLIHLVSKPETAANFQLAHITTANFQLALIEVLKGSNLFGNNIQHPITVKAMVEKATFPSVGFTMTSDLNVRYIFKDTNGTIIMDENIVSTGKATVGEEFSGYARSLLAFQRANEGHFALLISKLRQALEARKVGLEK